MKGKTLKINRFPGEEQVQAHAGQALNNILAANAGYAVLLMLSGGSALKLVNAIEPENLNENLSITVLDERFSQDPKINNFSQLQNTDFYKIALKKDVSFFGTSPRNIDTPRSLQERWETNLRNWAAENPNGKIIATIGMGPDGHIAGIFPHPEDEKKFNNLFLSDAWTVAYNVGTKNPYPDRVTTTITFLKKIDSAVVFVTGKEKITPLKKLASKSASLEELPAMALWDLKDAEVYTDIQN
jgi:6-phosphogluconolactonase/glucosamine-6-phosphate isomerase/deaminase